MCRCNDRRIAFAGDLMKSFQQARLQLSDFGGTFISPEQGQGRGETVCASYSEEDLEEKYRLEANDRLRRFVSVEDLPG